MINKFLTNTFILFTILLGSCIGTDIVEEQLVPERIVFTRLADSIKVGETFMFEAQFYNSIGLPVEEEIEWSSDDESVISINGSGLSMANMAGNATIVAMVRDVKEMVTVNSGEVNSIISEDRTGVFMGNADYTVEGDFTLTTGDGPLKLVFDSNFQASNGPGLFVYLSNNAGNVNGGVELGSLKSNSGAQEYNVPSSVSSGAYDYVLIYCKPFGVTFGFGEFEN